MSWAGQGGWEGEGGRIPGGEGDRAKVQPPGPEELGPDNDPGRRENPEPFTSAGPFGGKRSTPNSAQTEI